MPPATGPAATTAPSDHPLLGAFAGCIEPGQIHDGPSIRSVALASRRQIDDLVSSSVVTDHLNGESP
ncbi:MAG: hypothetical protein H0X45_10545 [Planctomycetes bacterium]|nr:hypothetical protein [Planctomycetota bacterium]